MREWFDTGLGRVGLFTLGVIALLAIGGLALAGRGVLSGADAQSAERAIQPTGAEEATPEPVAESAARTADKTEPENKADQIERAVEEPDPVPDKVSDAEADSASTSASASASASGATSASGSASASASASASGSAPASGSSSSPGAAPADTMMYLSVPAMGISDIPVVEGTSETSLSQGAGHVPGTGYPWVSGSNTYIAGHRIGYPGTPSDHVFWNLPNLVQGDQILLSDSNGTTYTYAVSE